MERPSASESTGLLARETLSGVSLAGIEHKTPPLTATADPLDDALHRGGAVSLMESPNRGAAAAPHYQSAVDTRSLLSVSTGVGAGGGGGDSHSIAGSLTAPHHHHSVHVMGGGGGGGGGAELNVDDIANPNADPNAVLVLGPTFDDAAGSRAAHDAATHDDCCSGSGCFGCCKCDAGRFLSHCWFCVACLSFVLLSSLPRLLTVADGVVTLVLYTSSHVRDSYGDPDAPDPHVPIPRSVGQFMAYDFDHFSFDKSAADVVVIALIRMVILFWVYAYRFHTHPYTLKTSALVMLCSTVYNAAKLGTNTHAALHVVLWYAFGITIVEYVLFILIRRRRIRAPEGVAEQFGFAPSPATSLISASERGALTSGGRGTGARTGVTPSSLLAAAQRYTRLDGDDDSATTPMKSGQTPSSARAPATANDYAALPPIGETQPQAAVVHRVQVRGGSAHSNPNASGAIGTPSSGLHASANAKAVPPSAIPDGTDPSALADPDSRFLVLDGLRVHYKLFRYAPPPAAAAAAAAAAGAGAGPAVAAGAGAERHTATADGSNAAAVATAATSAALAVDSSGVAGAKDDSAVGINRSAATTPSAAAAKGKLTHSAGRYASTGSGSDKKKQLNPQQRTSSGGDGDAAAQAAPTRIEVPIVLLHGFGGSTFSWRRVWKTLCANATCVLAFDRPGFGLTSRPLSGDGRKWTQPAADPNPSRAAAATAALDPTPTAVTNALLSSPLFEELMTAQSCSLNPYSHEYSVWLLFRVMSELGIRDAILVGHSTGGGLALRAAAVSAAASAKAAAAAADAPVQGQAQALAAALALDRVRAVCCISPSVYSGGFPDLVRSMFRTSLGKGIVQQLVRSELGEVAIRRAWHDPSRIPEEVGLNYKRLSRVLHWHEALVEMASVDDRKSARLSKLLGHVRAPVCILHGEDDRLVACSESAKTISRLTATTADLVLWPNGGHVPHEEYPDVFLTQLFAFLRRWEPYGFSTAAAAAATAAANAAANAAAAAAAKYNTR